MISSPFWIGLALAASAVARCTPTLQSLNTNFVKRQEVADELYEVLPEHLMQNATVHSIRTDLTPKINKNAIRKQIRFGLYLVPGSQEPSVGIQTDKADIVGALAIVERIESLCGGDCTILGGGAVPEFENGTAISTVGASIYNHHVFATNRDRPMDGHICPGQTNPPKKTPGAFMGGGTDQDYQLYTNPTGDINAGYEIKGTDKLDLAAEFMNYRTRSQKILIAFDFEYLSGKPEGYLSSQTLTFSATSCNQTLFNVPTKGKYTTKSKEWTMPVDGTLISVRGHEHDGGTGVHLLVNGKNICSSLPVYTPVIADGGSGELHYQVKEFPLCQAQYPLKKGDTIIVQADYDTEKYPQRHSNMGHMETVAAIALLTIGFPAGYQLP